MDGQLVPDGQDHIPEGAQRGMVRKTHFSFVGLGAGGILGAVLAGPVGALMVGLFGGLTGFRRGSLQRDKWTREQQYGFLLDLAVLSWRGNRFRLY